MRRAVAVLVLALLAGCGGSAADDAETGADPAVEDLAALVATGELRRLVDGGIDGRGCSPAGPPTPAPAARRGDR